MMLIKCFYTRLLIRGELGECHVLDIDVWQWIKHEFINIPPSLLCWKSLRWFSKAVLYSAQTAKQIRGVKQPTMTVFLPHFQIDIKDAFNNLAICSTGLDYTLGYSSYMLANHHQHLNCKVPKYFVSGEDKTE